MRVVLVTARRLAVAGALLLSGGCAERGLAAGPTPDTGAGTWAAVTVATVAATIALAALIVLPAMRPGGSVIAAWVLALQAAGAAIAAAIVIGAAIRTEQLLDRPDDAEQAASLLRLTVLDGRTTSFFTTVALVTLTLGGLLVAALVLAARFAADTDPLERTLACGLLAVEVAASLGSGVLLVLGFSHLGFVLPATALPVLVVATVAAWPRGASSGVEQRHG